MTCKIQSFNGIQLKANNNDYHCFKVKQRRGLTYDPYLTNLQRYSYTSRMGKKFHEKV